jgi:putative (di)nucleoside polyphosphate hydrolase
MSKKRDPDSLSYRPCVGICLFNSEGRVFAGHRKMREPAPYRWQLPQGGIDKGEEPLGAARRELFEETNVSSVRLLAEAPEWVSYDFPSDGGRRWSGKYRGQTQKWFAFLFEGDDAEIDVHNPGGDHHPEFDDWRWEALDAMPDLIVPFKRGAYEQMVTMFTPLAEELANG